MRGCPVGWRHGAAIRSGTLLYHGTLRYRTKFDLTLNLMLNDDVELLFKELPEVS